MKQALAGNLCRCGTHTRILQRGDARGEGIRRRIMNDTTFSFPARSPADRRRGRRELRARRSAAAIGAAQTPCADRLASRSTRTRSTASSRFMPTARSRFTPARWMSAPACASPMSQMAAEELGIPVERVALVEGDTALTPDQGGTGGSTGFRAAAWKSARRRRRRARRSARLGRRAAQAAGSGTDDRRRRGAARRRRARRQHRRA